MGAGGAMRVPPGVFRSRNALCTLFFSFFWFSVSLHLFSIVFHVFFLSFFVPFFHLFFFMCLVSGGADAGAGGASSSSGGVKIREHPLHAGAVFGMTDVMLGMPFRATYTTTSFVHLFFFDKR